MPFGDAVLWGSARHDLLKDDAFCLAELAEGAFNVFERVVGVNDRDLDIEEIFEGRFELLEAVEGVRLVFE